LLADALSVLEQHLVALAEVRWIDLGLALAGAAVDVVA